METDLATSHYLIRIAERGSKVSEFVLKHVLDEILERIVFENQFLFVLELFSPFKNEN